MKKILTLTLALVLAFALCACGGKTEAPVAEPAAPAAEPAAAPAGETYKVTFSTGDSFDLPAGEDLVFFIQCDAPGDMGAPNAGEEGAGVTVSQGTITYSNVGLGGPFSYPTSELVTVSGITGDVTVTLVEGSYSNGNPPAIYTDAQQIADAIAFAEEMAAQMAANPMPASGEASGEPSGEASGASEGGMPPIEKDLEVEFDGQTLNVHYVDVDNNDSATKSFTLTYDDVTVTGKIDHGIWTADDAADQAFIDAVKAVYEAGSMEPSA